MSFTKQSLLENEVDKFIQGPDGYPSIRMVPVDILGKRIVDVVSSALTYEGTANHGSATSAPVWQIKRIVTVGRESTIEYASDGEFNQIWDNRASLFGAIPFSNVNCIQFDGVNDYLQTPHGADLNFERTDPFSIAHWLNFSSVTGSQFLLSKRENAGNVRGWQTFYLGGSGIAFILSNTNVGNRLFVYGPALVPDTWYHVVFTYDGSSLASGVRLYLDGVQQSLVVSEDTLTGTIQTTVPTIFGSRSGATSNFFGGLADEPAVFNIELNQSQVDEIYNDGIVNDLSQLSTGGDLVSWWRFGDPPDVHPNIFDQIGLNNFTMLNMSNSAIVTSVP